MEESIMGIDLWGKDNCDENYKLILKIAKKRYLKSLIEEEAARHAYRAAKFSYAWKILKNAGVHFLSRYMIIRYSDGDQMAFLEKIEDNIIFVRYVNKRGKLLKSLIPINDLVNHIVSFKKP